MRRVDPHWLFILTPPYSGSTAVAMLMLTANNAVKLQERAEGQWLIPDLCDSARWDACKEVSFRAVRDVWEKELAALDEDIAQLVVVEKSPPHLMRAGGLRKEFPDSTFVALNRNPIARAASELFREHKHIAQHPEQRTGALQSIARRWITMTQAQERWIQSWSLPRFQYESICADPKSFADTLKQICPQLGALSLDERLSIKEYPPSRLRDHNERQLSLLERTEVRAIAKVLLEEPELLEAWGYLEMVDRAQKAG